MFTLFMFPACWGLMELCTPICGASWASVSASIFPAILTPATPCVVCPWYCTPGVTLPCPAGPVMPFNICPMLCLMSPRPCPLFSTVCLKPVLMLMPRPLDVPPGFWCWDEWLGEAMPGCPALVCRSCDSCLCLMAASVMTAPILPATPPS